MTFVRGATLTTATTLGHSDNSNLGPTAGNGFYTRWPDDLALLQELGITDLRLTFDWPRLQPKPGELDSAWSERLEQMIAACDAIGLRVWATLHDAGEPRWITNEGGMDDDDVTEKWWPRYVEKIADRFGPNVAGWIPFAGIDNQPTATGWRNTWATLNSGDSPVIATLDAQRPDDIADLLETSDMIGLIVTHDEITSPEPSDEQLDQIRAQFYETIGMAAQSASGQHLVISEFTPHHDDPDVAGQIVEAFVAAVDEAIADGVDLNLTFIDPAIAGPDSAVGLFSSDRIPQPTTTAYLPAVES